MPLALGVGLETQIQQSLNVAVIRGFVVVYPLLQFGFLSSIRRLC